MTTMAPITRSRFSKSDASQVTAEHTRTPSRSSTRRRGLAAFASATPLSMSVAATLHLGALVTACSPPPPEADAPAVADTPPLEVDPNVNSIAHALASSLASDTLRARLYRAFQESNLPEHRLNLNDYLAIDQMLSSRMQQHVPDSSVMAEIDGLQLWIPGALDRQRWTPDDNAIIVPIDIAALNSPDVIAAPMMGFRIGGDTVSVRSYTWIPETLVALMPADSITISEYDPSSLRVSLGTDVVPTIVGTISTPVDETRLLRQRGLRLDQGELSLPTDLFRPDQLLVPDESRLQDLLNVPDLVVVPSETFAPLDDSDDWIDEMVGEWVTQEGGVVGYDLGTSFAECYDSRNANDYHELDRDGDSLDDDCEYQIASEFAPVLMFDREESGSERETYWAVRTMESLEASVAVFYALGYYQDTGDVRPHNGDSEFIVLYVKNFGGARWAVWGVVMSAHYGQKLPPGADNSKGTFSPEWADTVGGRPVVWVSRGKHANYKSRQECNGGLYNWLQGIGHRTGLRDAEAVDICGDNPIRDSVYVQVDANIGGNGMVLVNCTWSQVGNGRSGMECLWDKDRVFRGWAGGDDGVTPYGRLLDAFGFAPYGTRSTTLSPAQVP